MGDSGGIKVGWMVGAKIRPRLSAQPLHFLPQLFHFVHRFEDQAQRRHVRRANLPQPDNLLQTADALVVEGPTDGVRVYDGRDQTVSAIGGNGAAGMCVSRFTTSMEQAKPGCGAERMTLMAELFIGRCMGFLVCMAKELKG